MDLGTESNIPFALWFLGIFIIFHLNYKKKIFDKIGILLKIKNPKLRFWVGLIIVLLPYQYVALQIENYFR